MLEKGDLKDILISEIYLKMGNKAFISSLDGANNSASARRFNWDELMRIPYIPEMFQKFSNETGKGYGDPDVSNFFDDLGVQINNDKEKKEQRNLVEELNELYTTGLCNPQYYVEKLKDLRFVKYFTAYEQDNSDYNEFYKEQYKKMFMLYCYILPYYTSGKHEKDDFFKEFAKLFVGENNGVMETFSLVFGMIYSFSLLKELKSTNPEILEKSLRHIHASLLNITRRSVKDDLDNYNNQINDQITEQRDFLVSLVEDKDINDTIKELAIRIILLFGYLRESGEDYLVAFNLLHSFPLKINIANELSRNSLSGSADTEESKDSTDIKKEDNKEEVDLF